LQLIPSQNQKGIKDFESRAQGAVLVSGRTSVLALRSFAQVALHAFQEFGVDHAEPPLPSTCSRIAWKRRSQRWPDNFIEIHPEDAAKRGIESGDSVRVWSERVPVQTGSELHVEGPDPTFTVLQKAGRIRLVSASVEAVAMVTPSMRQGVALMNFLHKSAPANALVPRVPDPISNRYRFERGVAHIDRTGESPCKGDLERMSFAPRNMG
jgi:hypothetical protein